jgi:hypothetical protein
MVLFSRPKCPIHKREYNVGKDYMCQPFYYCSKCRAQALSDKYQREKTEELEERIADIESRLTQKN